MKNILSGLALLLLALSPARAQITAEILQDQDQFLSGETVSLKVRVTNLSGRTLQMATQNDWLTFSIENQDQRPVLKLSEVDVAGEFSIESSKMATRRVELTPAYALIEPGRYRVTASILVPGLNHEIVTEQKNFDVVEGTTLWEREIGIPLVAGATNTAPQVRKYMLQQANNLKGKVRLFLRLMDESSHTSLKVVLVGPLLSFSHPEAQVDQNSNLHLLYQYGPHSYTYRVFTPNGDQSVRQTYDYITTRPRLRPDADLGVAVMGGERHLMADDLPERVPTAMPSVAPATNPPALSVTNTPAVKAKKKK